MQAQARQQAKACQSAIPVWVMTTQRALTTLDPREKFDVIIVDEASQSDMTALAVLFMGQRIVVVGDDQQVSPMGIGIKDGQIANMQREYLGNIPNASIYDENASLYDIIKTVSSPVMLREHFRCASEIIGFSNWLSYDGKIVPL
ncbi:MAG: AAA domain-containing protein [Duodenibacillus massiliensis]